MVGPTERDVDQSVDASMRMFERSQVGEVAPVAPQTPQSILVALDGSEQDALSLDLAGALKSRFEVAIQVVDCREDVAANQKAEEAAKRLDGTALAKPAGENFQQILDSIEKSACDLVIVPCPFGRNLQSLGTDSTGTVIDVLLSRSPVPLLIVREPYEPKTVFGNVKLILIDDNSAVRLAASWSASFVASGGHVEIVLLLEREFGRQLSQLAHMMSKETDVTLDMLAAVLEDRHTRLHRALQKTGEVRGFGCDLNVVRENDSEPLSAAVDQSRPLLVLPLERSDSLSQGFVRDCLCQSANPVLVVFTP